MPLSSVTQMVLASYIQQTVKGIREYVNETSIYPDFPSMKIRITGERTGCQGGTKMIDNIVVPYMEISLPYITEYTLSGFVEYQHISNDAEIGSIDHPCSWKHTMCVVICHEMSHVIDMMHIHYKVATKKVPRTFHSLSVELIGKEYENQKKYHGRRWQYVYRHLRNQFVNGKPDSFWL